MIEQLTCALLLDQLVRPALRVPALVELLLILRQFTAQAPACALCEAQRGPERKRALAAFCDVGQALGDDQKHLLGGVLDVVFGHAEAAQQAPNEAIIGLDRARESALRHGGV
jgi:hypothetical protein